jgi:hypothetical protein
VRDEDIALFGDVALVRSTNKWVRVIDGNAVTGMTTYTDTYIHEGGRWLCIQAQLTAVAMETGRATTPSSTPGCAACCSRSRQVWPKRNALLPVCRLHSALVP